MRIPSSSSSSSLLFCFLALLLAVATADNKNHDPVVGVGGGLALLPNLAANIPVCAYGCINDLTNVTINAETCLRYNKENECLCSDDVNHYMEVLGCVQRNCTLEESIETARGAWKACSSKPQRSKRHFLIPPLSIEVLAAICVFLRLWSRWRTQGSRFEVDDYVMIVVVMLYFVFMGVGIGAAMIAFGVDVWTVRSDVLGKAFKLFYISESFYITILALTKISILVFYLRIFPNKTFRLITYAVIFWVCLSSFIFVFCQIFQCLPVNHIWELGWVKGGQFGPGHPFFCLDINTLTYTIAAFSIAQDIFILLMPLPLLVKLNVSKRSKAGIIFMFSLGIFVLITSVIRLWAIYSFGDSVNPTWDYSDTIIWTGLEVAVSIIVTSLPAIRVLFSRRRGPNPLAGGRKDQRRVPISTSSFGDTNTSMTVVGGGGAAAAGSSPSWGSAPPNLKRISVGSRISSTNVETEGVVEEGDIEKQEQESQDVDLEDKMTRGLRRPFSEANTMVGIEDELSLEKTRSWYDGGGGGGGGGGGYHYVLVRDLKHMPSIDEILNGNSLGVGSRLTMGSTYSSMSSSLGSGSGSGSGSASRSQSL